MKKHFTQSLLLATFLVGHVNSAMADETTLPLAGTWKFRLDAEDVGVAEQWFAQEFEDTVQLPGTTDENHKGIKKDEQCIDRLSRVWYWKGPAWYQRRVTIPDAWKGKRITLLLERTKNTRVWVDQTFCGWEDTLSAPQVFDVTGAMTPGEHTITVLVDNARLPPVGPSHAVDERTQTNWNGIVGKMELRATDPVWLEDVQVYPDVEKKQAVVRAVIGNITGKAAAGRITVGCESYNVAKPSTFATQSVEVKAPERENVVEFTYQPGDDVPLWDEFQPAMLRLNLQLETTAGGEPYRDQRSVNFGMRDFATRAKPVHDQRPPGLPAGQARLLLLSPDRLSAHGQGRLAARLVDRQVVRDQPLPLPFVVSAGGGVRGGRRTGNVSPAGAAEQAQRVQRAGKQGGGAVTTSTGSTWRAPRPRSRSTITPSARAN